MPYCPSCGAPIDGKHKFCMKCGSPIDYEPEKFRYVELAEQISLEQRLPTLTTRQYWVWLILSWVTGIFSFVYLFFNFQDLTDLYKYPKSKETPSMRINFKDFIIPVVIVFVLTIAFGLFPIVLIFVDIYFKHQKYQNLYTYIQFNHSKQQKTIPLSESKYLRLALSSLFCYLISAGIPFALFSPIILNTPYLLAIIIASSAIIFICGLGISIYLIVAEYNWQEALNERILIVNPNAEQKVLF